jgi:hypothetical protein
LLDTKSVAMNSLLSLAECSIAPYRDGQQGESEEQRRLLSLAVLLHSAEGDRFRLKGDQFQVPTTVKGPSLLPPSRVQEAALAYSCNYRQLRCMDSNIALE